MRGNQNNNVIKRKTNIVAVHIFPLFVSRSSFWGLFHAHWNTNRFYRTSSSSSPWVASRACGIFFQFLGISRTCYVSLSSSPGLFVRKKMTRPLTRPPFVASSSWSSWRTSHDHHHTSKSSSTRGLSSRASIFFVNRRSSAQCGGVGWISCQRRETEVNQREDEATTTKTRT